MACSGPCQCAKWYRIPLIWNLGPDFEAFSGTGLPHIRMYQKNKSKVELRLKILVPVSYMANLQCKCNT